MAHRYPFVPLDIPIPVIAKRLMLTTADYADRSGSVIRRRSGRAMLFDDFSCHFNRLRLASEKMALVFCEGII